MFSIKKLHLPRNFSRLLRLNYLAWLSYFLIYFVYAFFWRQLSQSDEFEYTPFSSLIWFLKEWGIWLIISPFMLWCLDAAYRQRFRAYKFAAVLFVSLLVALGVRILLITGEYSSSPLAAIIFTLPKYIPAVLAIALGWYLFGRQLKVATDNACDNAQNGSRNTLDDNPLNNPSAAPDEPKSEHHEVTVEHNGLKFKLSAEEILYLKSSGNYVEIFCDERTYIQRCTFKQFLEALPAESFAQVHRSYAINLKKLEKLSNHENGSGIAILSDQQKIPVSKSYKAKLKSLTLPN